MASTYTCLKAHIVFATKGREECITTEWRGELHAYVGGIIKTLGGIPLGIGGTADHVHALVGLRATHAPADVVREIKKISSPWAAQRHGGFGWQVGYGVFTVSPEKVLDLLRYIAGQQEHHRTVSSADELRVLLAEHGVELDERYFE